MPLQKCLWRNLCSCCPSHRKGLCQPFLIASGTVNQVNEGLLLKGWQLTRLRLAAVGLGGLGQVAPARTSICKPVTELLAGRGRHRRWRRVSSLHSGTAFCLVWVLQVLYMQRSSVSCLLDVFCCLDSRGKLWNSD